MITPSRCGITSFSVAERRLHRVCRFPSPARSRHLGQVGQDRVTLGQNASKLARALAVLPEAA
jgi:hypothetical protein